MAASAAVVSTGLALIVPALSNAGAPASPAERARVRAELLAHREAGFWSGMARAALYGTGAHRPAEHEPGDGPVPGRDEARMTAADEPRAASPGTAAAPVAAAGLPNVSVNNPALDTHQTDQTTQSETAIAVSDNNVVVGFNDSQQGLTTYTAGQNLSGYAYSTDGGAHFTDGGTVPNPLNFTNAGDPWLTSDRAGNMYYSTLTYGGDVGNLEIGVAKSTNGGKTWSAPVLASPNDADLFYFGDKEAITAGRSPSNAAKDNLYVAWDDQSCDPFGDTCFNGLPVANSTDGGKTWDLRYADKIVSDFDTCSFGQYIGAQPFVDPADGTLYVAAEKFAVNDPDCTGGNAVRSEVIFKSTDGGKTFGKGVTIDFITPAAPADALVLGPGQFVRTLEFPTIAKQAGNLFVGWNDGRKGRSHIHVAESFDGGAHWTDRQVTFSTDNDEFQPALTGDQAGLHLAYYRRNASNTLDVVLGDSTDGVHFSASRVTTQAFPGVLTVPQFDPIIAFGYMGDYIAQVSVGGRQYFAWGDNRRTVVDFTFPQGRRDPDVFFARR